VTAIEDAGFEIRDQIGWLYGSGFPKSLDVGKAIDKAAGAEREVVGTDPSAARRNKTTSKFSGTYGTIDDAETCPITAPATDAAKQWDGWGTALKPAWEPIVVARKPLEGTVAGNVLKWGTGGINVDGCRVPATDKAQFPEGVISDTESTFGAGAGLCANRPRTADGSPSARFPANVIHDGSDEVLAEFAKYGESKSTGGRIGKKTNTVIGRNTAVGQYQAGDPGFGDTGTAARFFYTAKASKDDRNDGLHDYAHTDAAEMVDREPDSDGMNSPRAGAGRTSGAKNHHPTVKPTSLMRYLVRLVTPKGGTVLDPFAGSGTTLIAAYREDCQGIGIELDPEYFKMASHRIDRATAQLRLEL
jgi:site-specific DNA-methyltransferase (adenine-specific)